MCMSEIRDENNQEHHGKRNEVENVHATYHLKNDSIRIALWHHPSQRASTGHAETARVVNNDEISSTFVDAFRRQTDP